MEEKKEIMHTIRGDRRAIKLVKECKNIPGFAPEYYDVEVGDVVFNFPHNEDCVYFQPADSPPILEKEDVEQILEIMNRRFNPEDWKTKAQ